MTRARPKSRTAELAALGRASLTRDPEPFRGADDLAIRFLPPHMRFVVQTEPLRKLVRSIMVARLPGAYGLLSARSRRIDAFVRDELADGAQQLVVLGAGYDTRAYRFASELAGKRAFEVDAPATSASKRAIVGRAIGEASHVTFVAVDFEHQRLDERLVGAGFDPSLRTIFTWEGVTPYIGLDAVDAVLRFVASAAPGSGVIFDYVFRAVIDDTDTSKEARRTVAYVRGRGEPFVFGLDPREVDAFLGARGLALEEHLLPSELNRRLGSPERPVLRSAEFYALAIARVRPA